MSQIFAIVTYDEANRREEAAEAWKVNEVAALGWSRTGNLSKTDTIEKINEKLGTGSRGAWKSLEISQESKKRRSNLSIHNQEYHRLRWASYRSL